GCCSWRWRSWRGCRAGSPGRARSNGALQTGRGWSSAPPTTTGGPGELPEELPLVAGRPGLELPGPGRHGRPGRVRGRHGGDLVTAPQLSLEEQIATEVALRDYLISEAAYY